VLLQPDQNKFSIKTAIKNTNLSVINKLKLFSVLVIVTLLLWNDNYSAANTEQQISFDNELVDAADQNDLNSVIQLIRSGNAVDGRGLFGTTPLMRAAYQGADEVAEMLIKSGADVDAVDLGGATSLHLAARKGNIRIINLLLTAGSQVDATDNDGWTPLMRATNAKQLAVINLLLNKGADPYKTNKWLNNAIIDAVQTNDINIVKAFFNHNNLAKLTSSDKLKLISIAKNKKNPEIEKLISQINQPLEASIKAPEILDAPKLALNNDLTKNSNNLLIKDISNQDDKKEIAIIKQPVSDQKTINTLDKPATNFKNNEGFLNKIFKSSRKTSALSKEDYIELPQGEELIAADNQVKEPVLNFAKPVEPVEDKKLSFSALNPPVSNIQSDANKSLSPNHQAPSITKIPTVIKNSIIKDQAESQNKFAEQTPIVSNVIIDTEAVKLAPAKENVENIKIANNSEVLPIKIISRPAGTDKTVAVNNESWIEKSQASLPDKNAPSLQIKTAHVESEKKIVDNQTLVDTKLKFIPNKHKSNDHTPSNSKIIKNSLWIEAAIYDDYKIAENAYHAFKNNVIFKNLRIKIVKPYQKTGFRKTAIRVGPLLNNSDINKICSVISEGKNTCYLVKDFGKSVNIKGEQRQKQVSAFNYRNNSKAGNYWLQLGSFNKEEEAAIILKKNKVNILFSGLEHYIAVPKQSSNFDILYMLRAGPFKDRKSAESKCSNLINKKFSCIVIKE
jgi:ankyrin repeat protein